MQPRSSRIGDRRARKGRIARVIVAAPQFVVSAPPVDRRGRTGPAGKLRVRRIERLADRGGKVPRCGTVEPAALGRQQPRQGVEIGAPVFELGRGGEYLAGDLRTLVNQHVETATGDAGAAAVEAIDAGCSAEEIATEIYDLPVDVVRRIFAYRYAFVARCVTRLRVAQRDIELSPADELRLPQLAAEMRALLQSYVA
jgi:hypothetical protein